MVNRRAASGYGRPPLNARVKEGRNRAIRLLSGKIGRHLVSGIFLHTMTVCPVLESIRVVTGSQRQETVFAFSRLVTTQCSMTSAEGGGIRLRTGAGAGGAGAAAFFLAEQQHRHRIKSRKKKIDRDFLIATNSRGTRPI